MSLSIVARRYAQALLELGVEQGQLDQVVSEMRDLATLWEKSAELRNALENPMVAHAAKKTVVTEIANRMGVTSTVRHALQLLVDRRRTRTLPHVAQILGELADARRGVLRAEVTTAALLGEGYYGRLQTQLEKMTGKRVLIHRRTDPSLIGGVITRIGDRVIDGSLRTRLQSLRNAMRPPV